jgi:4-amino-4-deoxy-L-arabinose transferase-like glycosyltransferase
MSETFLKWWRSDNGILLLIGIIFVLAHFATNGQYGFHRDELQTLDDARHLDWGFVAYPLLTPAVGRLELALFGTSLFGIRVIPTLALALAVFTTGVIARELGGGRKAQILAALAVAIVPIVSIETNLLQYVSFDYLWGVLLIYFAVRLLNTSDPRWWVPIGVVIGIGMMTKYTMGFFVCGLAAGVFLTSARRHLFNRWLLLSVAISLLIFIPNLIWQIQHDFISLDYLRHIHARDVRIGRTRNFIPEQFAVCMNTLTLPLALMGLWFYFTKSGRKYRLLGWMYLATFVLFLIAQARSYYLAPLYPSLIAAGAVVWERWLAARSHRVSLAIQTVTWAFIVAGGIFTFALFTPVAPINSALWKAAAALHDNYVEEIGWTDLVENVARVYNSIPSEERARTGLLVGNYGEAGAINLLGERYGLPPAISGTNTNWYRTYPHSEPQTLIVVGFDLDDAKELFESCELVAHNTNAYGIRNEESRDWPDIFLCRGMRVSWPEFWRRFRRYG